MAYYQIVGLRSHTHFWFGFDTNALATAICNENAPFYRQGRHKDIQLIYGVKHSGATCLLITDAQMRAWARVLVKPPLSKPFASIDFESLSPITFQERGHLFTTLSAYKPKPAAKVPRSYDTSQANRDYELAGQDSGVQRGRFEHGRVFYRILKGELDDVHEFGITKTNWKDHSLVMISLVVNAVPRTLDGRSKQQQIEDPRICDVAWTQIELPSLQLMTHTTRLLLKSARMVSLRKSSASRTEVLDSDAVAARLQAALFHDHRDEHVVLLIWDWNRVSCALRKLGINRSGWEVGLKSLMGFNPPKKSPLQAHYHHRDRPRYQTTGASTSRRQRSLSPRDDPSRRYSSSGVRSRSPVRSHPLGRGSVNVIDVQEMFEALVPSLGNERSMDNVATHLGVATDEQSRQVFKIWLSMVSGAAIDEQKRAGVVSPKPVPPPAQHNPDDDQGFNDDDEDPNDFDPIDITLASRQPVPRLSMYDDDEDDDVGYE